LGTDQIVFAERKTLWALKEISGAIDALVELVAIKIVWEQSISTPARAHVIIGLV